MSITREQQKKKYRERMIPGQEMERQYRARKKAGRIITAAVLSAAVLAAAAAFLLYRFNRYSDYEISWEKDISEGSFVGYERLGDNVIRYSHDGASCIDRTGETVWVDSYEMKDPRISVSGSCACIYDCQSNLIKTYDTEGNAGASTTVFPVSKAAISEKGVYAAVVEDEEASRIEFYRKDGTALDIEIKTIMSEDGYPMDLALSPDGTGLMVAFACAGTQISSRVIFYDFSEIGKNIPNRLVGGFEEPFSNSLVAKVRFIDSVYSYAVSDTGITFFSSENLSSPEIVKQIPVEGTIDALFDSESHVGMVITDSKDNKKTEKLLWLRADGETELEKDIGFNYSYVSSDDSYVYFNNDSSCVIINRWGTEKYNGLIKDDAKVISKGKLPGCFVFSGASEIREYKFR